MQFKSFMEVLKGNQHKLDKNKNGKVDAHDFKLLRKEEDSCDTEDNDKEMKKKAKELDEKSDQAKQNKTMKNMMDASRGARFKNTPGTSAPDPEPQHKTARAHNVAIGRAIRQMSNEEKTSPFDGGTVTQPAKKNSDGTVQSPMSRARELAKQAMKKKMKEEFDIDMSDEQVDSILECMDEQAPVAPTLDKKYIKGTPEHKAYKATKKPINNMPTNVKEETELEESHFKVGDKVKCKSSGMKGEVVKLDKDHGDDDEKYYTVKRDDGEMKKMAPNDMTKLDENHLNDFRRFTQAAKNAKAKGDHDIAKDAEQKASKSAAHYTKVTGKKPTFNEETELDEVERKTISYSDFVSNLLEYETKDGVYKHKGTYGGSYNDPEGADDADDKKPKVQPADKRGRGRPAGAKSGARKITGTSKLYK